MAMGKRKRARDGAPPSGPEDTGEADFGPSTRTRLWGELRERDGVPNDGELETDHNLADDDGRAQACGLTRSGRRESEPFSRKARSWRTNCRLSSFRRVTITCFPELPPRLALDWGYPGSAIHHQSSIVEALTSADAVPGTGFLSLSELRLAETAARSLTIAPRSLVV